MTEERGAGLLDSSSMCSFGWKDSSMSPTLKADRTAKERWAEELARSPAREQPPTTVSGRPIEPLYTRERSERPRRRD